MSTVTSGHDLTVLILEPEEATALAVILEDWRNMAEQQIEDGYDPHGYTLGTWHAIRETATAFGVYDLILCQDAEVIA